MPSSDTIVVGGGTNGLACAFRLARAGQRVTVLEAAAEPGGGTRGRPFAEGFAAPPLAHLVTRLDPRVEGGMELARHGLAWAAADMATTALDAGGAHLVLRGGRAEGAAAAEAAAWEALRARLMAYAAALAPMLRMPPPRLARRAGNDWMALAKVGLGLRRLGAAEFREFLRLALSNVRDLLDDELADDRLKGVAAFDATLGAWAAPRSPNTVMLWLERLAGQAAGRQAAVALPAGGTPALAAAMAGACRAAGVTIRTGARVARITTDGERATGVELDGGEALAAGTVVSAMNPVTTLLSLVGPRALDAGMVTRLRQVRARGGAAKLHLALSGPPDFRGADPGTRLVIAPSAEAVELAFNPVKYAEVPDAPVMEIVIPSAFEAGHAPPGRHLLSAIVQFAPHDPPDREGARAAMLAACMATLERHAPGIGALVEAAEMLMPWDIAAGWDMPGGNWHHGELSVEQMAFLRPLPELAQYRTPVEGLWLASGGSHPGGGISGTAGWNAALAVVGARA